MTRFARLIWESVDMSVFAVVMAWLIVCLLTGELVDFFPSFLWSVIYSFAFCLPLMLIAYRVRGYMRKGKLTLTPEADDPGDGPITAMLSYCLRKVRRRVMPR